MASREIQLRNWWLAAGLALASIGCKGQTAPAVATDYVEGVVSLDGQPLEGATVTFVPVQEGTGVSATGRSDASGKYTLTAVGAGRGAQVGAGTKPDDYYVGVVKDTFPAPPKADEAQPAGDPSKRPPLAVTHVVPQGYNDPTKSGLKVTVKSGKNDIPLELKSK